MADNNNNENKKEDNTIFDIYKVCNFSILDNAIANIENRDVSNNNSQRLYDNNQDNDKEEKECKNKSKEQEENEDSSYIFMLYILFQEDKKEETAAIKFHNSLGHLIKSILKKSILLNQKKK